MSEPMGRETQHLLGQLKRIKRHLVFEDYDAIRRLVEQGKPMEGWICPKCGSVYSLLVPACGICRNSNVRTVTSDTANIKEER